MLNFFECASVNKKREIIFNKQQIEKVIELATIDNEKKYLELSLKRYNEVKE